VQKEHAQEIYDAQGVYDMMHAEQCTMRAEGVCDACTGSMMRAEECMMRAQEIYDAQASYDMIHAEACMMHAQGVYDACMNRGGL